MFQEMTIVALPCDLLPHLLFFGLLYFRFSGSLLIGSRTGREEFFRGSCMLYCPLPRNSVKLLGIVHKHAGDFCVLRIFRFGRTKEGLQ